MTRPQTILQREGLRRRVSTKIRADVFLAAGGVCHICKGKITGPGWEVEHVIPLAIGGADDESNMRPAHKLCHKGKSAVDSSDIARAKRREAKHLGAYRSARPMDGSRNSPWKKTFNHGTVPR